MVRAVPLLLALALAPAAQAAVPAVQAHRGGPVLAGVPTYAEESLPAFQNAARLQVVLELDAKLTADGVPVVFHDPTLDRTTNCEGPVVERTLAELAACQADILGAPGNDLPTAPAPEPVAIATLAEVLAFAKAEGIGINLEIKNYPTDDEDYDPTPAFANRVMDVVLESGIPARQVIIQSFTPGNLDVAKSRMPDAEFALLSLAGTNDFAIDVAASNGYDWISPAWPIDQAYVERAHGENLRVVPYTINQKADVEEAAKVGVDALISDDPLMALQTLDTKAALVQLEPLSTKLAKVRRRGKLRLRVASDEPVTAELIARLGRKVIGRKSVTLDDPGARPVAIPLNRRGRNALEDRETAKVKLVAKTRDLALNRGTARATAALR
jgi:glycerophosphoryl diester phosphodiesterase